MISAPTSELYEDAVLKATDAVCADIEVMLTEAENSGDEHERSIALKMRENFATIRAEAEVKVRAHLEKQANTPRHDYIVTRAE